MSELPPMRIQRIDRPERDLYCFSVRGGGQNDVLVLSTGAFVGVGLVPSRPRGLPADAFAQRLRRLLVGATIHAVHDADGQVQLDLSRREGDGVLVASADGLHFVDPLGGFGSTGRAPGLAERVGRLDRPELEARGEAVVRDLAEALLDAARTDARLALRRAAKRLGRKRSKIAADVARAKDADAHRHLADLLLAHVHRAETYRDDEGAQRTRVTAIDWAVPDGPERHIEIPPERTPQEHAAHLYKRAKKLERGAEIGARRLEEADAALGRLSAWRARVEEATSVAAVRAVLDEAREAGLKELQPRAASSASRGKRGAERRPYRVFESQGARILVGRGAKDNDALTLRHSKPHHHWLHARGVPGAHVVIVLDRGASPNPETLLDAATLAAHFSDARGQAQVEVDHTPRRHVRKPRGAAPGAVLLDRQKTLLLRFEASRLERLMRDERHL